MLFKYVADIVHTLKNQITFILAIHMHSYSLFVFFSLLFVCMFVCVCVWYHNHHLITLPSDVSCLQLAEHVVHLPVAACLAALLLPVGVLLHLGQEVATLILSRRRSSRLLQVDGGAAGFSNRGVLVKVAVSEWCFPPAGFTTGGLPLSPLPPQRCLGLNIAETVYNCHHESLEVAEDIYKEIIDGPADASLWPPGKKDELNSQQRDEDEGGSHCLHVGRGLSTVGAF